MAQAVCAWISPVINRQAKAAWGALAVWPGP